MKLVVTTERQKKYAKFGKWYIEDVEVNEYHGDEISTFEKNFFSYKMSAFGAKETRQYGYTCSGYKVVKNFNTLGDRRTVTTFSYKID